MSKKYSLHSSRPPLPNQDARRSRKSLDSSNLLSPAARSKGQYSHPLRKSLDLQSFRNAAHKNEPPGMYRGADAELQLAKQKAAAWVWHQRAVGEVVAPTKRSAITSTHTKTPSSSSRHDSAIDSGAAGPVKSRFYTEALKKQQQEQKMKQQQQEQEQQQEMHAEQLHVNSTPPAPANSNKEGKLTSLYDAFELSSLRDQMAQLVRKLEQAEIQQEPVKSEEAAGTSSKRMIRNKKLDSGLVNMPPNSLHSDISSSRMMRNMKLASEPMDSFHSDHHDYVTDLMKEDDQYRVDGDDMLRPVAGGSLRLNTDSHDGNILHQGKGNLRKSFSAIHKLFHKISKAVKGNSKGTVSHGDNELEESAFNHSGLGDPYAAQHNYQHYHYHHHHHHYHHHNYINVDDHHRQSEQDVNAFTKEVFRRRLSEGYVGKDEMSIKQRTANNVMAIVDGSDVDPSPVRRRRHSASEGLFSDNNSPNHPAPLYVKQSRSASLSDYDQITGLGYYPARLGRSVWAYSEEKDDDQITANMAAAATSSNYLSSPASRFTKPQTGSKLEDREEALLARQRRLSESFADNQADHVRLLNGTAALAPIQMNKTRTLLDKISASSQLLPLAARSNNGTSSAVRHNEHVIS